MPDKNGRSHTLVTVHVLTSTSHPPQYIWCCSCGADGAVRYDNDARARKDHSYHTKHETKGTN